MSKKRIQIKSEGEIAEESFTLLGNSTKRDNPDKIGRFGSGLKYSIAALLNIGVPFHVYSGLNRISFDTVKKQFRDQTFDVIRINGKETNFTTQMGPDWKAYDCIREIYANAMDEGLMLFDTIEGDAVEGDAVGIQQGTTTFLIDVTEETEKVVENFDHYFSHFRNDAFYETEHLKIYPSNGHLVIYKDGFKVFEDENKPSLFHYDYSRAKINESRTLKSLYSTANAIATIMIEKPSDQLLTQLKDAMHYKNFDSEIWEMNMDWWTFKTPSEKWKEYFSGQTIVSKGSREFYKDHVEGMKDAYIAPERLAKELKSIDEENIKVLGGSSSDRSNSFKPVKTSGEIENKTLSQAIDILEGAGLQIPYNISVAEFEYGHVLGTVDQKTDSIVVSSKALAKYSPMQVAEIIYEEYAHIESRQEDNSRGFQNYLVKQVIKYMMLLNDSKAEKGVA